MEQSTLEKKLIVDNTIASSFQTNTSLKHYIKHNKQQNEIKKKSVRLAIFKKLQFKFVSTFLKVCTRAFSCIFCVIHTSVYVNSNRNPNCETATAMDVVYALKRQGRTLYGFGG